VNLINDLCSIVELKLQVAMLYLKQFKQGRASFKLHADAKSSHKNFSMMLLLKCIVKMRLKELLQ